MRLEFSLLIGLMVGFLGLIPYLGMMICWIPAVIIAAAQFGDWWHPLVVTIIFVAANNIDGMIIAPKIVGESGGTASAHGHYFRSGLEPDPGRLFWARSLRSR